MTVPPSVVKGYVGVGLFIPSGWALLQKGSVFPLETHISRCLGLTLVFPGGSVVRNPSAIQETEFQSLAQEEPLEEEMATLSSILEWEIPQTEKPGGLQSVGSQRVQHALPTKQQSASFSLRRRRAVADFDPFPVSSQSAL